MDQFFTKEAIIFTSKLLGSIFVIFPLVVYLLRKISDSKFFEKVFPEKSSILSQVIYIVMFGSLVRVIVVPFFGFVFGFIFGNFAIFSVSNEKIFTFQLFLFIAGSVFGSYVVLRSDYKLKLNRFEKRIKKNTEDENKHF
jgi:hypothetical protein